MPCTETFNTAVADKSGALPQQATTNQGTGLDIHWSDISFSCIVITMADEGGQVLPGEGQNGQEPEFENPLELSNPMSIEAYKELLKRTNNTGIIDKDGLRKAPAPPSYTGDKPESNFDKPVGFIAVSRSFLPLTKQHFQTSAIKELFAGGGEGVASEKKVADMVALMQDIWAKVSRSLKSKLGLVLGKAVLDQEVPRGTNDPKHCANAREAIRAFLNMDPTLEMCEKIYNIFYMTLAVPGVKESIVYSVMMELKIWHTTGEHRNHTNTKKLKVSCFMTLCNEKAREFNNTLFKTKRATHSVKVTITVPKGGRLAHKLNRRKRDDAFDPLVNLVGWCSEQHRQFCKDNDFPEPVPLSDPSIPVSFTAYVSFIWVALTNRPFIDDDYNCRRRVRPHRGTLLSLPESDR